MENDSRKTDQPAAKRRPYRSPTMHCYGAIKDLTAGGSGNNVEKGGGMGMGMGKGMDMASMKDRP
jgi:hypothetical protein